VIAVNAVIAVIAPVALSPSRPLALSALPSRYFFRY
jgi:hypothetical protein